MPTMGVPAFRRDRLTRLVVLISTSIGAVLAIRTVTPTGKNLQSGHQRTRIQRGHERLCLAKWRGEKDAQARTRQ